ncbi:thiolase domain-containing protein [archaeon]|nr:thiolase domain-containing protein [archaeon]
MKNVAIIGAGLTKFGSHWDRDLVSLSVEAGIKAVHDAGISKEDVDALYGGTMSAGLFINQEHLASKLADFSGFRNIPSTRVEAACASGGVALRQGYLDIASGMNDVVVVGGVEKMTDVGLHSITKALATAASHTYEANLGATFPGLYAMIAKRHMHDYGTKETDLAEVSVKNHENAIHNKYAQFRRKINVDDVLNSQMIADPLKLLDCSPITDGASAVVLASADVAKKVCDTPIWIKGSGHAVDTISLHDRKDITTLNATKEAARQAYLQSKMTSNDIDCVEVHDCFTIAEILAIEDLGFAKKGEGGKFVSEGQANIGGKLAVNTSGGLKAKGHPIGATGVAQAIEATLQLRGDAKNRNTNAEVAMAHNVGGSGGTSTVHIFSRDR